MAASIVIDFIQNNNTEINNLIKTLSEIEDFNFEVLIDSIKESDFKTSEDNEAALELMNALLDNNILSANDKFNTYTTTFMFKKELYSDDFDLTKTILNIKDNERGLMITAIRYILIKDLGKKQAKKFIKELEGGIDMGIFVNELRMNRERELERKRRDGEEAGILKTAKNMLKKNIGIDVIEEVTGLKRSQFM